MSLSTFRERLKFAMEKKAWTYKDLAQYCKIQETMIYRYVRGKNEPSKKNMIKICAGLDITMAWLKDGEGNFDDRFNIEDYTNKEEKKVFLEKSPFGGYELLIKLKDSEVKQMIFTALK